MTSGNASNANHMYRSIQQDGPTYTAHISPHPPRHHPHSMSATAYTPTRVAAEHKHHAHPQHMRSATARTLTISAPVSDMYKNMNGVHDIVDVWQHNLAEEMRNIRSLVSDYQYVAMDSEFPGVVATPNADSESSEYKYKHLKCNVDQLKIIQLGLSFCDETGKNPPRTWQFNFHFDLKEDMYAEKSIAFLKTNGVNFAEHTSRGIDVIDFGELLITSGVVLNDELKWITFHSEYDYGYLINLLRNEELPESEKEFFELYRMYFPYSYDIKCLMENAGMRGGLSVLAKSLEVERIGPEHQAGSDSLLTASTFFKLREKYYPKGIDEKFNGLLYGYEDRRAIPSPALTSLRPSFANSSAISSSGLILNSITSSGAK